MSEDEIDGCAGCLFFVVGVSIALVALLAVVGATLQAL